MSENIGKIKNIFITKDVSILEALKKMDKVGVKLLIIVEVNKFVGLISIGDIQRAIINNIPFDASVNAIKRENIHVAYVDDDIEEIKKRMLLEKDECMPIINKDNQLVDVIFWEDLFVDEKSDDKGTLDIPVVIMAGGLGTRMKPLTNIIPKPLIPMGNKTISEEIIDRYNKLGINSFYMSINYKAEMIKWYFKEKAPLPYNLEFFTEDIPMGTIGSVHLLKDKIITPFFVNNCDIIIDQDYRDIYNYHVESKNMITMVCAIKTISIPYGTVVTGENGQLISMEEKPEIVLKINTGMYILEPCLIDKIPADRMYHITELLDEVKKENGNIGVFPIGENQYHDIGEWKYYQQAINKVALWD